MHVGASFENYFRRAFHENHLVTVRRGVNRGHSLSFGAKGQFAHTWILLFYFSLLKTNFPGGNNKRSFCWVTLNMPFVPFNHQLCIVAQKKCLHKEREAFTLENVAVSFCVKFAFRFVAHTRNVYHFGSSVNFAHCHFAFG